LHAFLMTPSTDTPVDQCLLAQVVELAKTAGETARGYFAQVRVGRRDNLNVRKKNDQSLLSEADTSLDVYIRRGLASMAPDVPIISEEAAAPDYAERRHWRRLWLVDPLDGTKHFLAGIPDYTINIALVEDGQPVLGVIYAPSRGRCYLGLAGNGAWMQLDRRSGTDRLLNCARRQSQWLDVMVSHGIPGARLRNFLAQHPSWQLYALGSSLKSCWIAQGLADVYPRFGDTCEWDTAAAQVILTEAGGGIFDKQGKALEYNKPDLLNPEFIAHAGWYQPPEVWYEESRKASLSISPAF